MMTEATEADTLPTRAAPVRVAGAWTWRAGRFVSRLGTPLASLLAGAWSRMANRECRAASRVSSQRATPMTRLIINMTPDYAPPSASRGPRIRPRAADLRVRVATPASVGRERSTAHLLVLLMVWLTFAASGLVFSEPAPVDALMMALVVILPAVGLATTTTTLVSFLAAWIACAAAAILAATQSHDVARSSMHTGVSLYLYVSAFVMATFVANKPRQHTELIFSGTLAAALVAAVAGIVGYLGLVPGAAELFTKFGRAAGTFKDPNVFGPFLVVGVVYLLHVALTRPAGRALAALAAAGILVLAVLLSFSRGAWFNLAVAAGLYGALAFVTANCATTRLRILGLAAVGVVMLALVGAAALQIDSVRDLLEQRASLTQSYDIGPEGRFGGQRKAMLLIAEHPFGIGAAQFAGVHHHEEAHNVYLSMMLSAGWIGGALYVALVAATLLLGAWRLTTPFEARPLLLVAYAAFVANVLEGAIIDSDHWRHFYLLMAIIWGMLPTGGGNEADEGEGATVGSN